MKILKSTQRYERWLGRHVRILEGDLALKHTQMRSAPFPFLRATYYRWAQIWGEICGDIARAPKVLAVGDLHVEEFWNVARRGRPPGVGRQRFRRGMAPAVHQRPDPPGYQRLSGGHGMRTENCRRSHPQGLLGCAGQRRPSVRAGRASILCCGRWRLSVCTMPKPTGQSSTRGRKAPAKRPREW